MPTKLFRPNDGLDVRSPTSNSQQNGTIVNPPRFAQFGGLASGKPRGVQRNDKSIRMPGSTINTPPVKANR